MVQQDQVKSLIEAIDLQENMNNERLVWKDEEILILWIENGSLSDELAKLRAALMATQARLFKSISYRTSPLQVTKHLAAARWAVIIQLLAGRQ